MKKMQSVVTTLAIALLAFGCNTQTQQKNDSYFVSISADRMNVLYIGVDNPVSIAISGVPADKMSASISSGTLTGSNGKYVAKPAGKAGDMAAITVNAIVMNGNKADTVKAGTMNFRLKYVPDPVAYLSTGSKGDVTLSKEELAKADGVQARIENFDFDMKFDVVSFEMVAGVNNLVKTLKSNSGSFTPEMKDLIAKVEAGAHITIQNVHIKSTDGTERVIPGLNIEVK